MSIFRTRIFMRILVMLQGRSSDNRYMSTSRLENEASLGRDKDQLGFGVSKPKQI